MLIIRVAKLEKVVRGYYFKRVTIRAVRGYYMLLVPPFLETVQTNLSITPAPPY